MAVSKRYTWDINVASFENLQFGESKTSRRFVIVKDHISYTWCLKLYPKGLNIDGVDNANLLLAFVFLAGPKESLYISSNATGDRNSVLLYTNSSKTGKEFKVGSEYYALIIAPANIPANYTGANDNRTLTIIVNTIHQPDLFTNLPFLDILEPAPFHSLDRLLLKVLSGDEDKLSDFSIVAGEHIYATDRRILASRCDYFHEFFVEGGEGWVEKTTKQFPSPVRKRAMDEILTFIYTDRINIPRNETGVDVELVQELVCGTDYFRIPDLQKYYERPLYDYLIANQSNKSALSLFIFADRYDFKLLKNCALSILYVQFDSIEEYVTDRLSNPARNSAEREDEIMIMWKTLKQSRPDNISLFDELFAYMRQTNVTQL